MFLTACFAVALFVFATVAFLFSMALFQEEEGVTFLAGIACFCIGCALGAWSFMLFVHAAQLA